MCARFAVCPLHLAEAVIVRSPAAAGLRAIDALAPHDDDLRDALAPLLGDPPTATVNDKAPEVPRGEVGLALAERAMFEFAQLLFEARVAERKNMGGFRESCHGRSADED